MPVKELKFKPLVEAILEVRWALQSLGVGREHDPHYRLLLGRFSDRVKDDYPAYEQLPLASVPDELIGHTVQHRFRVEQKRWPLLQLGPGVMTVNSTSDYTWADFQPRVLTAVERLYKSHPKTDEFKVSQLILRYIDAVEFDYRGADAYAFLREKLKLDLRLPENLFDDTGVKSRPATFSWQTAFSSNSPPGIINVKFATGQKEGQPAIIWESTVQSTGDDLPSLPDAFGKWFEEAHKLTDDWFFKLIEGDLERRFSGE